MAIDTPARHIYSGDGSTRVFPIPTYIQGDDYIRIEINGVHQVDRSKWDIVNNSIIFVTAPITTATIDVQVATSVEALSELGNVTNVDIVAGNIASINGIGANLDEILEADNNAIIATTKASEASASAVVATTKASEASASATSALASATIATNKANEASTNASIATTKASEASTSASTATTKASEASTSATSASSSAIIASSGATTATTKANEASTSAINALASENKAKKWADESEDVPVESGLYSAKHWAAKAADIVGSGLIDDVSPSTSTVFSSTRSNNTYEPKNNNIQGHISNNTTNPHNVTKSQVGLSNVDNTSDVDKPVSTATSTALADKQATLVSGTNIKTVNGTSILGSGDIVTPVTTISNTLTSTSNIEALSANMGKVLNDSKLDKSGGTPAGTIITFASSTAPTGYLKANGALLSRTTYSALFAAIGTTFGAGDGSTTFALPDLRGYFPRGWDDGRGIDTSRVFGSSQNDGYLNHEHTASSSSSSHSHTGYSTGGSGATVGIQRAYTSGNTVTSLENSGAHTHTITVNNSTTGTTETRPKNIALLYCIKY